MINFLLDQGASLVSINHDDKMPIDVAADSDIRYVLQQKMTEAGVLMTFDLVCVMLSFDAYFLMHTDLDAH